MSAQTRQPYSEPSLVCYGSIARLTRGTGSGGDGAGGGAGMGAGTGAGSGAPAVMIQLMAKLPTTE